MGFRRFARLRSPEPVAGYGLRTFRPGDEQAWIDILNTGDFAPWDRVRLDRMLSDVRELVPSEGIYFATWGGRPIGCTSTHLHVDQGEAGAELGWVAVRPEHRGHGLAMQTCRAVLHYIGSRGYEYAYLKTEDFRLPAIKTYLRLGFEPEMVDETHPGRWAALRRALGPHDSDMPS
jgi:mycothiol synthase